MISENDLESLKKISLNRAGKMDIIVEMVDKIETTKAGKWKFIVRVV